MKSIRVILLLLALLIPAPARSQNRQAASGEVVDYMVATVNGGLITYSDLMWQLALQPGESLDKPSAEKLRGTLELLIDQRLIFQEAEKLPHIHAEGKEVEAALSELIRRFPSQAEFQQRLVRTGLTAERLREILSERVDVEKYLDFRFRSFTVVTPGEVESYYRTTYVPRLRRRSSGLIVPELEKVRGEIERELTEAKVESELSKFVEETRSQAEIIILSPL